MSQANAARIMVVTCPGCNTALKVKTRSVEKLVACPKCGTSVTASDRSANNASQAPIEDLPFLELDETPGAAARPNAPGRGNALEAARAGLKQGLREIGAAGAASAGQVARLFQAGKSKLVERRLRAEADTAVAALGDKLHRAGAGDPGLRAELTEVNEKILSLATAKASTRAAVTEQLGLRLRLAEPFLTEAAPPGLEAEHEQAVAARRVLDEHLQASAQARAALIPAGRRERLRVAAGLGAAAVVVAVVLFLLFRSGGGPSPGPVVPPVAKGIPGELENPERDPAAETVQSHDVEPHVPAQSFEQAPQTQPTQQADAARQAAKEKVDRAVARISSLERQKRDWLLANSGPQRAAGKKLVVWPNERLLDQARFEYQQALHAYEQTK